MGTLLQAAGAMLRATCGIWIMGLIVPEEGDDGDVVEVEGDGGTVGVAVEEPLWIVPTAGSSTGEVTAVEDGADVAGLGPLGAAEEVMGPAPVVAPPCCSAAASARASAATWARRSAVRKMSRVGMSSGSICEGQRTAIERQAFYTPDTAKRPPSPP
jgi:hypothetical protein